MDNINHKSKRLPWILSVIAILIAVYFGVQAKDKDDVHSSKPSKIELPKQWQGNVEFGIVIGKDPNSTVFIVDSDGNEIKPCKTCTPGKEKKYGTGCKDAPASENICKAFKSLIPLENKTVSILHGRGSNCWLVLPSGDDFVGIPAGCTP